MPPTHPNPDLALPDCAGGESFALMVIGHSMAPEFLEGFYSLIKIVSPLKSMVNRYLL